MQGSLEIRHNFAGETGYVIMVPKKTTAPLSNVVCTIDGVINQTRKVYPAPHSEVSVLIEDLEQVWYFIRFYRSADGVALDEEILTIAGNAKSGAAYPVTRYEYVVDRGNDNISEGTGDEVWSDPVSGTIELRDERLAYKYYWVQERGTGDLLQISSSKEILDRSDAGGGFDFTQPGKQFNEGGVYVVTVIEKTDVADSGGSGGGSSLSIVNLTADDTFDTATMNGALIFANKAGSGLLTLTFGALAGIGNCSFSVSTHGGNQDYLALQLNAGDTVKHQRKDRNVILMGKGEDISIVIDSNIMYVVQDGISKVVGQRIFGDRTELNTIVRDGTRYAISALPRINQWIDDGTLDVVSEIQWASSVVIHGETVYPYKHKFTREGGQIRVPDDRDFIAGGLKNTDGVTSDPEYVTQKPGGYQHYSTSLKGIQLQLRDGSGGSSTGTLENRGFSGQDNPAAWLDDNVIGDGAEKYIREKAGTTKQTREKKFGMLPLLCI